MMRRFAAITGLVVLSTLGISTAARAGEGGIAGSAAFTIDASAIVGVAVSAAVGKENASAAAFNYDGANANGLQNSAWALGSAGIQDFSAIGDPNGFNVTPVADTDRGTAQVNTFSTGTVTVQLGTASGDAVVKAP